MPLNRQKPPFTPSAFRLNAVNAAIFWLITLLWLILTTVNALVPEKIQAMGRPWLSSPNDIMACLFASLSQKS